MKRTEVTYQAQKYRLSFLSEGLDFQSLISFIVLEVFSATDKKAVFSMAFGRLTIQVWGQHKIKIQIHFTGLNTGISSVDTHF